MRRMSFSFIALNTWSVNLPPGICLMCSSMLLPGGATVGTDGSGAGAAESASRGAVAIE